MTESPAPITVIAVEAGDSDEEWGCGFRAVSLRDVPGRPGA